MLNGKTFYTKHEHSWGPELLRCQSYETLKFHK